jgi:hypothetical protein
MKKITVVLVIAVVFAACPVNAQELSGLAGTSDATPARESTYAWQLEYLEGLGEHFAYSLDYLNEGHITAHHRDGDAILIWGRRDFFDRHLALGAGVGPYYYFDTLQAGTNSYNNDHGWGAMVSYTATWYTAERLFYQVRLNWVYTDNRSFDTRSLLFGFGYQLAPPSSTGPLNNAPPQREDTTKNEVTVFYGNTILNSFGSEPANSCVIEYRRHLSRYVDWTLSYLYEGENDNFGRSGVTSQLWFGRSFFSDHLSVGFGAGGYATLEYRNAQAHNDSDTFLSGIVTMTTSYRFLPQWSVRISWNRIVTNYNADADGILVGIGYHF